MYHRFNKKNSTNIWETIRFPHIKFLSDFVQNEVKTHILWASNMDREHQIRIYLSDNRNSQILWEHVLLALINGPTKHQFGFVHVDLLSRVLLIHIDDAEKYLASFSYAL